jgi:hypothetical protein
MQSWSFFRSQCFSIWWRLIVIRKDGLLPQNLESVEAKGQSLPDGFQRRFLEAPELEESLQVCDESLNPFILKKYVEKKLRVIFKKVNLSLKFYLNKGCNDEK